MEDPNFDLGYHVRRTALPEPGGDKQLADLMARVMSQRLDRDHPLWEYWVVEGLAGARWGLISKVHHSMVDGVSSTDLYRVIFELTPEPFPLPAPDDRTVGAEPSSVSLAAQAVVDMAILPRAAGSRAVAAPRPLPAARSSRQPARRGPSRRWRRRCWPAARSSLSGQIGGQRRYAWARASLADIKTVKGGFGGTVNDVVLAAISGGLRALLLARGEEPKLHEVPSPGSRLPAGPGRREHLREPRVGDGR